MRRIRKRIVIKPLTARSVWLLSILMFLLMTVVGLAVINTGVKPTLMIYAESQTKKIGALVISKAVNREIANVMDINEIIENVPTDSAEMVTTKFNTEIINRVLTETTELVQEQLRAIERGDTRVLKSLTELDLEVEDAGELEGIVYTVPLGQATGNALLGNLGPKVPIRFHAVGNVTSDIRSDIDEFGINNAFVQINIHLVVDVQIIVPFATEVTTVEQDIPVAMGLIQGQVPEIYNMGDGMSPSLEVPLPTD
ncbi:sporulation protein YunB [Jeotgalibacillus haloalkalitolerans]|uniref:Sporulation protein YunB n=1 Tax=Jeotgalibacillus haloalkalitolerans TaxID=3104292 RepID=A0ABU5KQS8_9BACL|nr:sporulation protein YunB [Jeotgalibacillus sp. HH7-29]MDZ5713604.1 sporulation protein YunB [Jeotgalibacillus sp. HH7-29]